METKSEFARILENTRCEAYDFNVDSYCDRCYNYKNCNKFYIDECFCGEHGIEMTVCHGCEKDTESIMRFFKHTLSEKVKEAESSLNSIRSVCFFMHTLSEKVKEAESSLNSIRSVISALDVPETK